MSRVDPMDAFNAALQARMKKDLLGQRLLESAQPAVRSGKLPIRPSELDARLEPIDRTELILGATGLQAAMASRTAHFPSEMFGDAPWDILLALYVRGDEPPITMSRLSILLATPVSTLIRWVTYLEGQMYVVTAEASSDPNLRLIELSLRGWSAMDASLTDLLRI